MKKIIFMSFIVGITLMFASSAMAVLPAPTGLSCDVDVGGNNVCCEWDDVTEATKYSLDVFVPVTLVPECSPEEITAEFSFGTSERTDGEPMSNSNLCVPLSELVYDKNCDGTDDQLSGDSFWKVKALAPGHGKGPQNNPFSDPVTVVLPSVEE